MFVVISRRTSKVLTLSIRDSYHVTEILNGCAQVCAKKDRIKNGIFIYDSLINQVQHWCSKDIPGTADHNYTPFLTCSSHLRSSIKASQHLQEPLTLNIHSDEPIF